jgi:hypothetical protein
VETNPTKPTSVEVMEVKSPFAEPLVVSERSVRAWVDDLLAMNESVKAKHAKNLRMMRDKYGWQPGVPETDR